MHIYLIDAAAFSRRQCAPELRFLPSQEGVGLTAGRGAGSRDRAVRNLGFCSVERGAPLSARAGIHPLGLFRIFLGHTDIKDTLRGDLCRSRIGVRVGFLFWECSLSIWTLLLHSVMSIVAILRALTCDANYMPKHQAEPWRSPGRALSEPCQNPVRTCQNPVRALSEPSGRSPKQVAASRAGSRGDRGKSRRSR